MPARQHGQSGLSVSETWKNEIAIIAALDRKRGSGRPPTHATIKDKVD
jgi:hypothetical protein